MQFTECNNLNIVNAFLKAKEILGSHLTPVVAISGGADSDIMLDLCSKIDADKKIKYVWYDTGLEYNATKEHIDFLEDKYGVNISRAKAVYSIPYSCKHYGSPFFTKYVSEMINRLQRHNFTWVDGTYEELSEQFPNCSVALKWWCNANGEKSRFNIEQNKYLKEFLISTPPPIFDF